MAELKDGAVTPSVEVFTQRVRDNLAALRESFDKDPRVPMTPAAPAAQPIGHPIRPKGY